MLGAEKVEAIAVGHDSLIKVRRCETALIKGMLCYLFVVKQNEPRHDATTPRSTK